MSRDLIPFELHRIQTDTLNKMLGMKSCVVALMPGLGKTRLVLEHSRLEGLKGNRSLFVIPKSARASFTKELSGRVSLFIDASNRSNISLDELERSNYIIIENSIIGDIKEKLFEFCSNNSVNLYVDEAHSLQSDKSAFTSIMWDIRLKCIGVVLVTASPLLNSIQGLFNLYHFAYPTVFKRWTTFSQRYCVFQDKEIRIRGRRSVIHEVVGYKNVEELNDILSRLTLKGKIDYNVSYHFLPVPMDESRLGYYEKASAGLLNYSGSEEGKEFATRLHDLQRLIDGCAFGEVTELLTSKVRECCRLIHEICSRGESCLVYFEYLDSLELLRKVIDHNKSKLSVSRIFVLTGAQKEEERVQIEQSIKPGDVVLMSQAGRQCFAKGTEVIMGDGSVRNIENIVVGDYVMGLDSTPRRVVEIHSGTDQMYRVDQNHASSYIVNSQHILSLYGTDKKGDHYHTIKDLSVVDFSTMKQWRRDHLKGIKVGYDLPELDLPIPPYILGLWIGDGVRNRSDLCINKDEIPIYNAWRNYAESLGMHLKVYNEDRMAPTYSMSSGVNGKANMFTRFVRENCPNKRIPDIYLRGSRKQRLELLAGLIDTDGSKHRESLTFSSCREELAYQVKFLCDSLGYHTHIKKSCKEGRFKKSDLYELFISGSFEDLPLRLLKKIPVKRKESKDYRLSTISVSPVGEGEFYGIEIEGDPHFLLKDGTIVHNSRNLQRSNNLIIFNTPFSIGDCLQLTGRICRVDTVFKEQNIYFIYTEKTIDQYKVILFKDHLSLIDKLLGEECRGTLTCDYVEIDRTRLSALKHSTLWRC